MENPANPNPDKEAEKLLVDFEQAVNAGETAKSYDVAVRLLAHATKRAENHSSPWLDCANKASSAVRKADWSDAEHWYREALTAAIEEDGLSISKAYGDLSQFLSFMGHDAEALAAAEAGVENALKWDLIPVVVMALGAKTSILSPVRTAKQPPLPPKVDKYTRLLAFRPQMREPHIVKHPPDLKPRSGRIIRSQGQRPGCHFRGAKSCSNECARSVALQ